MLTIVGKICSKCNEEFPATLEYFHKDHIAKSGLQSQCKKCRCDGQREYQRSEVGNTYHKKYRQQYYFTIDGYLRFIFGSMKQRCSDPKAHNYHRYGGRGIKVCFTSDEFVDYVMNKLQVDPRGLTIDRIDNNGNYEPGNIRFVTAKINQQNRNNCKHNVKKRNK